MGIPQQPVARHQHITFLVQTGQLEPIGLQTVVVNHPRVEFEPADAVQDLHRPQAGLDAHAHQWMLGAQRVGHERDPGGRTGHHAKPQFTGKPAA
ncbi:Uncharacterised protein [Mycobacteroides abscessus subsp. abscessus]|nr:Uncharacterised protein [Mycobacteroides abscessus subsp. abscessus]SHU61020.1 Uncharacterised protein [Mycobacteroides abscessus subsp. abscessus]SHV46401.1 Uncharacterised protein [Mycobacteroides abscessus subsp. abscessus]SIC30168.1 Uncharacterised protein [Mycobacteroides abscessus subsp. abscessus]SIK89257.1 Uncharacterised protein [Mycobacteroides abscessus subsp. abscessus]